MYIITANILLGVSLAEAMNIVSDDVLCTSHNRREHCKDMDDKPIRGKFALHSDKSPIVSVSKFDNGYRSGKTKYYDNFGSKIQSSNFNKGVKNGVEHVYHTNGKVWLAAKYRNGLLNGEETVKDSRGRYQGRFVYSQGVLKRGECVLDDGSKYIFSAQEIKQYPHNTLLTCGER